MRNRFDQFSKQFLDQLLAPAGQVEISREVLGESRFIDLYFIPDSERAANLEDLGLLGRMAAEVCILEPYRNAPSAREIRSCLVKLLSLQLELEGRANREKKKFSESDLPRLWILTPTASVSLRQRLRAEPIESWTQGVYFLAELLMTRFVVIHQLPVEPETLWLRLLGKDQVQEQAIAEVIELSVSEPKRARALELLSNWKIMIEADPEFAAQERKLIMALSPAYLEWKQQTELEGEQRGRRVTLANLLRVRFGKLDRQLETVIEKYLELTEDEYAQEFPLLLNLSQQELIHRFGHQLMNGTGEN